MDLPARRAWRSARNIAAFFLLWAVSFAILNWAGRAAAYNVNPLTYSLDDKYGCPGWLKCQRYFAADPSSSPTLPVDNAYTDFVIGRRAPDRIVWEVEGTNLAWAIFLALGPALVVLAGWLVQRREARREAPVGKLRPLIGGAVWRFWLALDATSLVGLCYSNWWLESCSNQLPYPRPTHWWEWLWFYVVESDWGYYQDNGTIRILLFGGLVWGVPVLVLAWRDRRRLRATQPGAAQTAPPASPEPAPPAPLAMPTMPPATRSWWWRLGLLAVTLVAAVNIGCVEEIVHYGGWHRFMRDAFHTTMGILFGLQIVILAIAWLARWWRRRKPRPPAEESWADGHAAGWDEAAASAER